MSDYYRAAIESAKKEINSTSDDRVIGMSPEEWIEYLVSKYGMDEIRLDESRQEELEEVETIHTQRGYDIYSGREPGSTVRQTQVRVKVPVTPSDTIQVIWNLGLAPNTFHMTTYPEFEYDPGHGFFADVVGPQAEDIRRRIGEIKTAVANYNQSIRDGLPGLRQEVTRAVHSKRARVQEKHKGLDDLEKAVGIKLVKKTDISTAIPTVPKVKAAIRPLLPPPSKPQERPVLDDATFKGILTLIDNQGRQFERTPQSFLQLTEEGLRDIVLGSLNAVYEGAATGEAFQRIGKVDIHLQIAQGEVFIAELKFWDGPATLKEVVGQVLARLTWRDSYGVAIILARNADFTALLKSVQETVPNLDGFTGTVRVVAENHFAARFTLPSDKGRQATVHVVVYNVYVAEAPKRIVKQSGKTR